MNGKTYHVKMPVDLDQMLKELTERVRQRSPLGDELSRAAVLRTALRLGVQQLLAKYRDDMPVC